MTGESPSVPNFGLYQADDEYMDDSDILGQDSYTDDMEIEEFDASQYKSASFFSEIMVLVAAATALVAIAVVLIRIRSKRNNDRSDIENLKHRDEGSILVLNSDDNSKAQVQ